jgi:hypothetical protein
VVLESAHGPLPSLAEHIAGEPIRGSWWSHPLAHEIFAAIQQVRDSPTVVATRLVSGKVTLIHRRLWPALVRAADRFPGDRMAAVREEHTPSGTHHKIETPFPDWVPADVMAEARALTLEAALERLQACFARKP